jgi:cell division septum initiation protein DivIVA
MGQDIFTNLKESWKILSNERKSNYSIIKNAHKHLQLIEETATTHADLLQIQHYIIF